MKRCRCCRQSWPLEFFTVCRPDGLRRSTCNACRKGCNDRTRHKVVTERMQRARRRNGISDQPLTCHSCGSEWSRPVALGRPPMRCPACRRARKLPIWGGRIVLGPLPCQGCRETVAWNGYAWEDAAGNRHSCDNTGGGVSTESNRLPAATVAFLLTPGEGRRVASGSKTDA